MTIDYMLSSLQAYRAVWGDAPMDFAGHEPLVEAQKAREFEKFAQTHADCFARSCPVGHFTGSALVTDGSLGYVLLTLHAKLKIWLQLGGHADDDPRIERVALREACEESGLDGFAFLDYEKLFAPAAPPPLIFDIDRHLIPARPTEPAHFHYDVRYVLVTDKAKPLNISDESHDLKWFSLAEAAEVTAEVSMHRQFAKLKYLREALRRSDVRGDSPSGSRSAPTLSKQ